MKHRHCTQNALQGFKCYGLSAEVESKLYSFAFAAMDAEHAEICSRNIVRTILYANLFLFAVFVIPTTHHWVDRVFFTLRSTNMEDLVGRSLQAWLLGSTIVATGLFGLIAWKNRRATRSARSLKLEGILLFSWWIIVVGACAYGLILGMGG